MIRFLILCAIFLGFQNNLLAIELMSSIHQPQTSFRYVDNKKIGLKIKGTGFTSNGFDTMKVDEDFNGAKTTDMFVKTTYVGLDTEVFHSKFSNIGVFFDAEIAGKPDKNKRSINTDLRVGGFLRLIGGEVFGFSPFIRFDSSVGMILMLEGELKFAGNNLKLGASGGAAYYFSQFYGVEFSYGYGLEYLKNFGQKDPLNVRLTDVSLSLGLKTTFF